LIADLYQVPILASLGVVAIAISASIVFSMVRAPAVRQESGAPEKLRIAS
jgi:hypothetical protein